MRPTAEGFDRGAAPARFRRRWRGRRPGRTAHRTGRAARPSSPSAARSGRGGWRVRARRPRPTTRGAGPRTRMRPSSRTGQPDATTPAMPACMSAPGKPIISSSRAMSGTAVSHADNTASRCDTDGRARMSARVIVAVGDEQVALERVDGSALPWQAKCQIVASPMPQVSPLGSPGRPDRRDQRADLRDLGARERQPVPPRGRRAPRSAAAPAAALRPLSRPVGLVRPCVRSARTPRSRDRRRPARRGPPRAGEASPYPRGGRSSALRRQSPPEEGSHDRVPRPFEHPPNPASPAGLCRHTG